MKNNYKALCIDLLPTAVMLAGFYLHNTIFVWLGFALFLGMEFRRFRINQIESKIAQQKLNDTIVNLKKHLETLSQQDKFKNEVEIHDALESIMIELEKSKK